MGDGGKTFKTHTHTQRIERKKTQWPRFYGLQTIQSKYSKRERHTNRSGKTSLTPCLIIFATLILHHLPFPHAAPMEGFKRKKKKKKKTTTAGPGKEVMNETCSVKKERRTQSRKLAAPRNHIAQALSVSPLPPPSYTLSTLHYGCSGSGGDNCPSLPGCQIGVARNNSQIVLESYSTILEEKETKVPYYVYLPLNEEKESRDGHV